MHTSQMFANIYLNEVDQYIKQKLHIKYYCRYLDDSVVIVQTKQEAKYSLEKIKKFLKENLELELKKIKHLKAKIKSGELTSKEAKKYLAGHMGYIKYADVKNLTDKLFYNED